MEGGAPPPCGARRRGAGASVGDDRRVDRRAGGLFASLAASSRSAEPPRRPRLGPAPTRPRGRCPGRGRLRRDRGGGGTGRPVGEGSRRSGRGRGRGFAGGPRGPSPSAPPCAPAARNGAPWRAAGRSTPSARRSWRKRSTASSRGGRRRLRRRGLRRARPPARPVRARPARTAPSGLRTALRRGTGREKRTAPGPSEAPCSADRGPGADPETLRPGKPQVAGVIEDQAFLVSQKMRSISAMSSRAFSPVFGSVDALAADRAFRVSLTSWCSSGYFSKCGALK